MLKMPIGMNSSHSRFHVRPRWRLGGSLVSAVALTVLCGCPDPGQTIKLHEPLALADAVALVNRNNEPLSVTLKAVGGHARGQITDTDGSVRRFDFDAALLVKAPRCLRLDMTALLESQIVFGSNPTRYWVVQPAARALSYGRHDTRIVPNANDLIIRPDLFVEALGLNLLDTDTAGDTGPVLRNTDEHQQLLYLDYDDNQQGYIAKEYWISRRDPQVITRIVFRDTAGRVALDSQIDRYRRIGDAGGPLVPHRIRLVAPATRSWLEFTAWGWKQMPDIGPEHPAFVFPLERGEKFEQIVDLDVELDKLHNPFTEEERLQQLIAP